MFLMYHHLTFMRFGKVKALTSIRHSTAQRQWVHCSFWIFLKISFIPSHHLIFFRSKEHKQSKHKHTSSFQSIADILPDYTSIFTMIRNISIVLLALAMASTDAFKFMSNWQPPKILTDEQKVKIAQMEERFGDKSEYLARHFTSYTVLSVESI